jgi:STE24 endopeptidase
LNIYDAKEAKRYNKIKIRLTFLGLGLVILYLGLFQALLSSSLKSFAFSLTPNFYYAFSVYLVSFCLLYYALTFPLHFYSGFILERKFRMSNQRFPGWLKDDIKSSILSLAMFFIFMHALYVFLKIFNTGWWAWIALFYFFGTVIIARITPTLIIPLFFKYSEVEEGLKKRIIGLSKKCRINVLNVYKLDFSKKTNKLNAAVTGLGKSRRVILADNLINDFTHEEIAGVLAHEFGHHKLFHMWKLILFGAVSTFFSFFLLYLVSSGIVAFFNAEGVGDMRIFPVILLVLFLAGFLAMPLQNGFSRSLEREADRFALRVTGDREAFVSLMKKLAQKNLADPNPPKLIRFLFYSHPPISERIAQAKK